MKTKILLAVVGVILFASLTWACEEPNPCCVDGDQVEIHILTGNMLTATFKVPLPGTYTLDIVIKNLKGIPIKRVHESGVWDCSYGKGEDGKYTVYIYLKGRPLKPWTNYFIFVTMSITTSPQEVEQYYPMEAPQ